MSRILILGGGVAGTSAAIFLASAGVEVVVLEKGPGEKNSSLPAIGESLPPEARKLLEHLGVWERFTQGPHLPCHGHRSYWGSAKPDFQDNLFNPLGHSWHLDRKSFDDLLAIRARELGVLFCEESAPDSLAHSVDHWTANGEEFDFVIDATGRKRWLSRRLGIAKLIDDDRLALVAFFEAEEALADSTSLIESTQDGWWYSAAIPGHRLATTFVCLPEISRHADWEKLLERAPQTSERIVQGGFKLLAPPRFVSAESGILEQLSGKGWLAIGDAAMSYDPIAAHGIMMAMVSARDAATAITQALENHSDSLLQYHRKLTAAFSQYVLKRHQLYALIEVP